jgi:DMSO/TMAO reductase YedYZ molybdopterin-dependent catalytic subunit
MNDVHSQLRRAGIGAILGLLAAGVAIGAGETAAAFVRPAASPVIAVGNRFILLTPEPLKRWAIRQFGTHDKPVLLSGIYLGIAVLAVVLGILALRKRAFGIGGIAVLGAVGGYAALTANAHRSSDVIPSLVGASCGVAALMLLHDRAAAITDVALANAQLAEEGIPPASESRQASESRRASSRLADRRRFLQGGAVAAGVAALSGFGGRAMQRTRYDASAARAAVTLPAAKDVVPVAATSYDLGKSGIPFIVPARDFYRIDTALSVPQLDPKKWKLRIHGMVARELTLSYDQLLARPLIERAITLTCVSNEVGGDLIGNALFRGVRLADLLREAGVSAQADQLLATSSDGMTIGSPTAVVMDGRDSLLAVGMNGQPLPTEHGFPVRMVVPGLYGYVSACKWIIDLEATTFGQQQAYWVQGGWAQQGSIRLASRIDTPSSNGIVKVGTSVPIAGVAWDQHVGVSRVEVQVDHGDWQGAQLASVPSTDTWRQWVLMWTPAAAGPHTISVRAVDAGGTRQDESQRDPFPAGSTGLHTITVRAR